MSAAESETKRELQDVPFCFQHSRHLVLNFLIILLIWHYLQLLLWVTKSLLYYPLLLGPASFWRIIAQQKAYIKSFTVQLTKKSFWPAHFKVVPWFTFLAFTTWKTSVLLLVSRMQQRWCDACGYMSSTLTHLGTWSPT